MRVTNDGSFMKESSQIQLTCNWSEAGMLGITNFVYNSG